VIVDATRLGQLLVGLPQVTILGVDDSPVGTPIVGVLLAIARAAPCSPADRRGELRAVLTQDPELFTDQIMVTAHTR